MTAGFGGPRHTLRIGGLMTVLSLKSTVREPEALVFLILFPLLLLVVFGSIFGAVVDSPIGGTDVEMRQYFVAGIIAASIFGTAFLNLSIGIAAQQHDGSLRQLAAGPLPKPAFFIGQIGASTIITAAQIIVMLIVGILGFGVAFPDAGGWLTLAWIVPLGVAAGCTMGIAITAIIPSARAAPAITNAPYIFLQFISGVFFPFHTLPGWMQWIATPFPIRWMAQGLRSVFLPDEFRYQEDQSVVGVRVGRDRAGPLDRGGAAVRGAHVPLGSVGRVGAVTQSTPGRMLASGVRVWGRPLRGLRSA